MLIIQLLDKLLRGNKIAPLALIQQFLITLFSIFRALSSWRFNKKEKNRCSMSPMITFSLRSSFLKKNLYMPLPYFWKSFVRIYNSMFLKKNFCTSLSNALHNIHKRGFFQKWEVASVKFWIVESYLFAKYEVFW